jgi:hypothetical protein
MSRPANIGLAEMRAKFAREALLDLPPDAPAEVRQQAERRHAEALAQFHAAFWGRLKGGHRS